MNTVLASTATAEPMTVISSTGKASARFEDSNIVATTFTQILNPLPM